LLTHATFDHIAHAKFFADLTNIDSLAFVHKGGGAGDNHQVREARERGNRVLGYPVTQIPKVLLSA
jgi:hypothetical protein